MNQWWLKKIYLKFLKERKLCFCLTLKISKNANLKNKIKYNVNIQILWKTFTAKYVNTEIFTYSFNKNILFKLENN